MSHHKKPFVNRAHLERRLEELREEAAQMPTKGDARPEDAGEVAMGWYLEGLRRGVLLTVAEVEEAAR